VSGKIVVTTRVVRHYHLVLTKHHFDRPERNEWNNETLKFLNTKIAAINGRNVNMLSSFQEYCDKQLKEYIKSNNDLVMIKTKLEFKSEGAKEIDLGDVSLLHHSFMDRLRKGSLYLTLLEKAITGFEILKYEEVNLELKKIENEKIVEPPYLKFAKDWQTVVVIEVPDYDPNVHEDRREFEGAEILLVFQGKKFVKSEGGEKAEVKMDTMKTGEYFLKVPIAAAAKEISEWTKSFKDGYLIFDFTFQKRV